MDRDFQLISLYVPTQTFRRPNRTLWPNKSESPFTTFNLSALRTQTTQVNWPKTIYPKSAFIIYKQFYTMISFDPHNNPGRQANWHQHHLTEEETATQRNKGLVQGHSSQDGQTRTRTQVFPPLVRHPFIHYIR